MDKPTATAPLPLRAPVENDPLIGALIGSYRVTSRIGEGGMGSVYLAEHPRIGSRVAIKVLHPRYAADKSIVDRFFNEARAVNMIAHHNIVQVLDFNVTESGRHFFVMEYLRGRPLQALLRDGEPLALDLAGRVVLQCCLALGAAHARGIVHRDLKPDNIFLVEQGGRSDFVKLLDFGIAKLSDGSAERTQTGLVLGTPAYMSPEQAAGESALDARSDIYSLGVILYQLVTGKPPFGLGPSRKLILAHLTEKPPPPRSLCPTLSARLDSLILRALEKEPGQRQASMGELSDELTAAMVELGLSTELPHPATSGEYPRVERSRPSAGPAPAATPTPPADTSPGSTAVLHDTPRGAALNALEQLFLEPIPGESVNNALSQDDAPGATAVLARSNNDAPGATAVIAGRSRGGPKPAGVPDAVPEPPKTMRLDREPPAQRETVVLRRRHPVVARVFGLLGAVALGLVAMLGVTWLRAQWSDVRPAPPTQAMKSERPHAEGHAGIANAAPPKVEPQEPAHAKITAGASPAASPAPEKTKLERTHRLRAAGAVVARAEATPPPDTAAAVASVPAVAAAEPAAASEVDPEPPAAPAPTGETAMLLLVSSPRATFKVAWTGGFAEGETPSPVAVPRHAHVRVMYSKEGYVGLVRELTADKPQTVLTVELDPQR